MACDPNECSELLPKIKAAYYALLAGERKTSFKYRERTITYQAASPGIMLQLKTELMRLESKCGCSSNGRLKPLRLGRGHHGRCC